VLQDLQSFFNRPAVNSDVESGLRSEEPTYNFPGTGRDHLTTKCELPLLRFQAFTASSAAARNGKTTAKQPSELGS
jgi:hypothetical protein